MFNRRRGYSEFLTRIKFYSDLAGKNKTCLFFLLSFNLVFYVICITCFPGFSSDDFYLIYLISRNPLPVSSDPNEIFYLYVRPVFYFFFHTGYNLLGDPFLMKLFSIGLHLILVTVIFYFISGAAALFNIKRSPLKVTLAVLLFSVHPDVMWYILHLNDLTELLMLLFYTSALLVFISYLRNKISARLFIPAFSVLFLLSAFSKQTGIHLPVICLFIIFFINFKCIKKIFCFLVPTKNNSSFAANGSSCVKYFGSAGFPGSRSFILKTAAAVSFAMILFVAGFSYVNFVLYGADAGEVSTVLNKPLSASGTILFTIFPFIAERIYEFFLTHKMAAYIIAAFIMSVTSAYTFRYKKFSHWIMGVCFILVLFFPRTAVLGGGRINTHLFLWFTILVYYKLVKGKVYLFTVFAIYLCLMTVYSISILAEVMERQNAKDTQIAGLETLLRKSSPKKLFIALSNSAAFIHEFTYKKNRKFIKVETLWQPLIYKYLFPGMEEEKKVIECKKTDNILIFNTLEDNVYIGDNPINRMKKTYYTQPLGKADREYKKFLIQLPDSVYKYYIIIFYNGTSWEGAK